MLCAVPPERNTGMVTVDLSGVNLLKRHFPNAEIVLFGWGVMGPYAYREGEVPFDYRDILTHSHNYLNADLRVIWGDFLQSAVHWLPDPSTWDQPVDLDPNNISRITFLKDAHDEILRRTIVFGSTIITNQAKDQLEPIYSNAFKDFITRAGGILFRDALSAAKVAPYRGGEQTLGMDCAFLLQNEDLLQLKGFKPAEQRSGVGVFFGRSPGPLKLLSFSRMVARALGEECSWLPWFWSRRRLRFLGRLFGYQLKNAHPLPGELLSQLSGYRFIVTDTYHLCINAWRMGIPAICIGMGADALGGTLADKKKEILYEMYNARAFYVFGENLATYRGRKVQAAAAAKTLSDDRLISAVFDNLQVHISSASNRLRSALDAATSA
jgi:hypothetical protein